MTSLVKRAQMRLSVDHTSQRTFGGPLVNHDDSLSSRCFSSDEDLAPAPKDRKRLISSLSLLEDQDSDSDRDDDADGGNAPFIMSRRQRALSENLEPWTQTQLSVIGRGDNGAVYATQTAGSVVKELLNNSALEISISLRIGRRGHPNIVEIGQAFIDAKSSHVYITMADYSNGGNLQQRIHRRDPTLDVQRIGQQVNLALAFCHQRNILHGDVKPANVMFDNEGHARLIDFGCARYARPSTGNVDIADVCSLIYRPPELLLKRLMSAKKLAAANDLVCTMAVDVWSAGCLIIECLTKREPFFGTTDPALVASMIARLGPPSKSVWPGAHLDFISSELRPRAPTFGSSIWLVLSSNGAPKPVMDALKKMMQWNPSARCTCAEAAALLVY